MIVIKCESCGSEFEYEPILLGYECIHAARRCNACLLKQLQQQEAEYIAKKLRDERIQPGSVQTGGAAKANSYQLNGPTPLRCDPLYDAHYWSDPSRIANEEAELARFRGHIEKWRAYLKGYAFINDLDYEFYIPFPTIVGGALFLLNKAAKGENLALQGLYRVYCRTTNYQSETAHEIRSRIRKVFIGAMPRSLGIILKMLSDNENSEYLKMSAVKMLSDARDVLPTNIGGELLPICLREESHEVISCTLALVSSLPSGKETIARFAEDLPTHDPKAQGRMHIAACLLPFIPASASGENKVPGFLDSLLTHDPKTYNEVLIGLGEEKLEPGGFAAGIVKRMLPRVTANTVGLFFRAMENANKRGFWHPFPTGGKEVVDHLPGTISVVGTTSGGLRYGIHHTGPPMFTEKMERKFRVTIYYERLKGMLLELGEEERDRVLAALREYDHSFADRVLHGVPQTFWRD